MDATVLMGLVDVRDSLLSRAEAIRKELGLVQADIAKTCHHPITVRRTSYMEGGYDYVSVSACWDHCITCGAAMNRKETTGGFA
ncbi:hypothetical protein GNX71_18500 [Variovorax sp. RKNM96]|uniref:hypothetical protein n=1 Tax=Variovorax sp. RKNM96 TaxID=2681552 RepID=UPI0019822664|nr:hypothetical protein [Variovorax sp. RKNM96]QSI31461.1 hypothetical protein GNX71_18500 [Variovorax sp. RKNM96]